MDGRLFFFLLCFRQVPPPYQFQFFWVGQYIDIETKSSNLDSFYFLFFFFFASSLGEGN